MATSIIPKMMKALVVTDQGTVEIKQVPVPEPKENEILLKVLAIGQNPTDWKHAAYISKPGYRIGCDCAGSVVALGSAVPSSVSLGQTRWVFVHGGISETQGAFAEYVCMDWDLTGVVPSNMRAEEGAGVGIPLATAVQALFFRLKLPEPPKKANGEWIVIWSGATAVGQYAIQLAKLSGLRVATTASPKRWDLTKKLGADVVLDYKDPDVVKKLKEATDDGIVYGIDCISEDSTLPLAEASFSTTKGGHLIVLLFDTSSLANRPDVKVEGTLGYTVLGHPASFGTFSSVFPSPPEDRALYARWCAKSGDLFESGELKPIEVEVLGGMEDVQKGFKIMAEGKHNNKLVYTIA